MIERVAIDRWRAADGSTIALDGAYWVVRDPAGNVVGRFLYLSDAKKEVSRR